MEDYLLAETPIVERLQDRLPDDVAVLAPRDLDGVKEKYQEAPAAHVVYAGEAKVEGARNGSQTLITQRWAVVGVVRNVRDLKQGSAARAEAGPMLAQIIQALMGWPPTLGLTPLIHVKAPWTPSWRNGFFYYPLAFNTTLKLVKGDQ